MENENKVIRGITTSKKLKEIMKEKGAEMVTIEGQDNVTAEQFNDLLDTIAGTNITMKATDKTVVEDVLNGDAPTPTDVSITINVSGLDEGDVATGTIGDEVIQSFPAEITREEGTTETLEVSCEGYVTVTEEVTFDEDKTVNVTLEKKPTPVEQIDFKSAVRMDVSGATAQDNPGIVENGDKYEVVKENNTILVTDEGLIPYVGGNIDEPKKWVGILVDLGVKVQGTEYNIEDVDYTEAARWGAENDTTFLMWLTTEKGGEYTFTNLEDETDTIDITVEFTD